MISNKLMKILIAAFFPVFANCFVFSSLQSAKLLARNEISILPEYSSVLYTHVSDLEHVSNVFGFQGGFGLTNSFNLFIHYDRIQLTRYEVGYNYTSLDFKISLMKNTLALSMPVCLYFGKNIEFSGSIHAQPTLFFTYPINSRINITVAPKAVVFLPSFKNILALNINTGLSCFSDRITIIPEIGYGFKPYGKDQFLFGSFGIAFNSKITR
jgi:hypothetical protein